jgi:hypothetical protein
MLAALVALAVAWLIVPPRSVPLYDGIGFPDEPYRYVSAPAGTKHTPPATSASSLSDAAAGHNLHPFYANSAEIGPQVSVYVGPGVLVVPAGIPTVSLTATPLAPDVQPVGAKADGNVYRITATAGVGAGTTGTIGLRANRQSADGTVTMRATTARQPRPTFYFRAYPTDAWRSLDTTRVGNDIYRTDLTGLGDYVLAFGASAASSGPGSNMTLTTIATAGGFVVVFVGVIVAIRLHRRRAQT